MLFVYFLCCALSTVVNIGVQYLSSIVLKDWQRGLNLDILFVFYGSLFLGTISGLFLKYILDKRYVFKYKSENAKMEMKVATMYLIMGVGTTIVFWGIEILFELMFGGALKYVGAVIGLSIGYYIKYCLDKKYVFVK